jgi:hypothetical protein
MNFDKKNFQITFFFKGLVAVCHSFRIYFSLYNNLKSLINSKNPEPDFDAGNQLIENSLGPDPQHFR